MTFPFLLSKIIATFLFYLFDFESKFTRKSIFKILESLYILIRFKYNILLNSVGKRPTEITNCQPLYLEWQNSFLPVIILSSLLHYCRNMFDYQLLNELVSLESGRRTFEKGIGVYLF